MKIASAGKPTLDPAAKPDKAHDAKTAAKQLESFFLRTMLTEARPKDSIDGGFAGDTFKQMFDDAIADKMSGTGGLGLTELFAKQLGKLDEVAAAPATPAADAPLHRPPSLTEAVDPATLAGVPHFVLPVAGRASSGYGLRNDPLSGGTVNHPGFDLAAVTGTQVAAAARGTVVHAGPAGTYGNLVTVRHENGFETRYAHLSAVDVVVGDVVEAGQDVGKVGTTGYSTGPHLHFEVRHDGAAIDPAPLLPLHSSTVRTTR